jgi:iron complex outermembrane recepter protein
VKMLNFDISGRYDHYSDFGGDFTPKAGFKFTPIKQVAFRGTYSKGFRAPAFAENGSSSSEGFITQTPASSYPASFCAPTVHSTAYCLPYTFGIITAANPNIKPEKSDSYTFGLILEPISQFSASFDFYDIKKRNTIVPGNSGSRAGSLFCGPTDSAGARRTAGSAGSVIPGLAASAPGGFQRVRQCKRADHRWYRHRPARQTRVRSMGQVHQRSIRHQDLQLQAGV